ncbi:hypothetical protein E5D57_005501 [Metarhizium anisopliae]|nr:hypothetical protein E5D57_005501 [Metarhizium anisopliae]
MKTSSAVIAAIIGFASYGSAHMQMSDPPPFLSKFNKFTEQGKQDDSMTSPLLASGSNFPCKGYHSLVGTPQGQSVATWTPGQSYKMTIAGTATHNGGSCQASLSFDSGKTWKVIHSYVGSCPLQDGAAFSFTVPSDTPAGDALFAWTWFNQLGNREMYMNCAAVTIGGGAKIRKARGDTTPFSSRPAMFTANIGNGCSTEESKDVVFPDPGSELDTKSDKPAPPAGSCGTKGSGSGSGSGSASAPAPAASGALVNNSNNNAGNPSAPPASTPSPTPVSTAAAASTPKLVGSGGSCRAK